MTGPAASVLGQRRASAALVYALSLLVLTALSWSRPAHAQTMALEGHIKAFYLFKFAGFVEWPEGSFARPDSPLQIGVAGNDTLASQLELMVAGRMVDGHAVTVRRIRRGESLAGAHMLFIGPDEPSATAELLAAARGQPVLTVSDATQNEAGACMIVFVVTGQRLRFNVAMQHVAAARLRISARMLAAALRIQGAT